MSLSDFVQEVTGESHLRVEQDLGDGFVRLEISEAERRQAIQDIRSSEDVVLELLRNSRDAHARNIYLAVNRSDKTRILTIIDDGDGIPQNMHELVFEPRVTSKLETSHIDKWGYHGRGMALYSIACNAESAAVLKSKPEFGTALSVRTNLEKLFEKKDQSSFPVFRIVEDGSVAVRGPKNIIRTACEFAIEVRNECNVFVGSATEIAATLYESACSTKFIADSLIANDVESLPITKRLITAKTPDEFAHLATSLGLEMGDRSARRIMDGEITALDPLLDLIKIDQAESAVDLCEKPKSTKAVSKPLSLSTEDRNSFSEDVAKSFGKLADKYYLNPVITPRVRILGNSLQISIPLIKDER